MFVSSNSLLELKKYFQAELIDLFSDREVKSMFKDLIFNRLNISSLMAIDLKEVKLSESDLLFFRSVINRLKNEEPFQYIIEESWFCDLKLKADKRALIPRPETEELVYWVKEYFLNDEYTFADLCAGSGCIALGLKSFYLKSSVKALELSEEAIELIEENRLRTKLDVEIIELDVLNTCAYAAAILPKSFDCWVSNPPYIPNSDKKLMAKNVLEFEPDMALFVEDENPLVFYKEIARNALTYLKPEGFLFFEIHEDLAENVVKMLSQLGFVNIEVRKDLQGKDRMVKAQQVSSLHE